MRSWEYLVWVSFVCSLMLGCELHRLYSCENPECSWHCGEAYGCTGELLLWELYICLSWLCFCKCIHCSFVLIWERIDKHTWGRNFLLNCVSVEFIEDEELLVCVKFVLFEPEPLPCKCCITSAPHSDSLFICFSCLISAFVILKSNLSMFLLPHVDLCQK